MLVESILPSSIITTPINPPLRSPLLNRRLLVLTTRELRPRLDRPLPLPLKRVKIVSITLAKLYPRKNLAKKEVPIASTIRINRSTTTSVLARF